MSATLPRPSNAFGSASLAQAAPPPGEIIGLLAWILVAAVGTALVLFCLRLWLKNREDDPDVKVGLGFTLEDLRRMRDQGQLDEAEFENARARLIARTSDGPGGSTEERRSAGTDAARSASVPGPDGAAAGDVDPSDGFFIEPVEEDPAEGESGGARPSTPE